MAFQTYVSIFTVSCRRLILRLPLGAAAAILPRLLIAACRYRWLLLLLLLLLLLSVSLLPPLQVHAALHVMCVWELHGKREGSSAPSCRALLFLLCTGSASGGRDRHKNRATPTLPQPLGMRTDLVKERKALHFKQLLHLQQVGVQRVCGEGAAG